MTYYAQINSKNILVGIGNAPLIKDEYGSENVQNIEVSEEYYNNWITHGQNYYVYINDEIVINPEWDNIQLEKAKADKIALNDELRDNALISGVTYKDVLFDSDTDQKVNLLAIITTMPDDDNIVWFGMNNEPLMCSKADLIAIGELITELHAYCWMRNAEIKQEIAEAETMEQLNEVDISYDR